MLSANPSSVPAGTRSLPITEKSLLYSTARTFAEYLAQSPTYSALLQARCREIRLDGVEQEFFAAYPNVTHLLILIEEESPDTIAVLPVFQRMMRYAPRIDLRILCVDNDSVDDSVDLMNILTPLIEDEDVLAALPDADFPLVLVLDEEWTYQDQWGPHPEEADSYIEAWIADHPEYEALANEEANNGSDDASSDTSDDAGDEVDETYELLLDQLTYEMRLWYNSSLNQTCARSFRALLESLAEDENDSQSDD